MTASPLTIGFDVRPGNSGPARYVAALVRGLSGAGWNAVFLDSSKHSTAPLADVSNVSGRRTATSFHRAVPAFARCWAGFHRESSRLASKLRSTSVDILHTQNTGCEEMPVAARWAGLPRVLGTFHVDSTYDLERVRSGLTHRVLEWYSNRSLHRAIAVSEATKRDWMRRTGIAADRVVTVHNGIDPDHFRRRQSIESARGQLGLPQDAVVLGGLGRLDPAKGFGDLVEALALLHSEFPQLYVAIAGAGPLRESLAALAAARGVAGHVVLLGFQPDVNLVLDACDVFVLPSLCEALPFALLEAMAHELPIVGTSVGGVPEVIVAGETGFVSLPRNPPALAATLRPVVASAALRERLGRAGRERVQRHFHERDMIHKTVDVYREMVRGQPMQRKPAIA